MKLREFLERINRQVASAPDLLDYTVAAEHDTISTRCPVPVVGLDIRTANDEEESNLFLVKYYYPSTDL